MSGYQETTVGIYKYKRIVMVLKKKKLFLIWILTFKWNICYTETINCLQSTINVRKSHRQPQCHLLLLCEGRGFLVWVDLQVCWRGQQHPKLRAKKSFPVRVFLFLLTPLFTQSHKQKSNAVSSDDSKSCITVTIRNKDQCSCQIFLYYLYYHLPKYWLFLLNHPVFCDFQ